MAKFRSGLVQEYKHAQQEKAEQERLRREHHINDSSVVVVEKDSSVSAVYESLAGSCRLQQPFSW